MENCPDCGTHLTGGWVQRTREVIELPVVPVQVTEHVFIARTCPVCRRRRVPTAQLDGAALGRQRLGVNLISRIATLREEGRLPIRSIQWYLRTVHQLSLSVGAIVSAIHQTAQQAQPAVAGMVDRIRASPVVHADETAPTVPALPAPQASAKLNPFTSNRPRLNGLPVHVLSSKAFASGPDGGCGRWHFRDPYPLN